MDPSDNTRDQTPSKPMPGPATFSRGPLLACYALLAGGLVYVLVARCFLPLYQSERIGVVNEASDGKTSLTNGVPAAAAVEQKIDPNTATWSELTRLPRVGETMAKRIVQYRQEHPRTDGPVFQRAEDLGRVRGIGPKTIAGMRSLLKFPASRPGPPEPAPHR